MRASSRRDLVLGAGFAMLAVGGLGFVVQLPFWVYPLAMLVGGLFGLTVFGPTDPTSWATAFWLLEFVVKPLVLFVAPSVDAVAAGLFAIWPQVLQFELLSLGAFYVGRSVVGSVFAGTPIRQAIVGGSRTAIVVVYAVVWIARLYSLHHTQSGSLADVTGRVSELSVVVIAWLLVATGGRLVQRSMFAGVLLLELVWTLMSHSKLPLAQDGVAAIFTLAVTKRLRTAHVLVAGSILLLMFGEVTILRGTGAGSGPVTAALSDLIGRSDNFDTAVRVFAMPSVDPFRGLALLKNLAITVLLPMPIPGKPYIAVGNVVANAYYGIRNPSVYLGLGFATSLFASFGSAVAVAVMAALGRAFDWLWCAIRGLRSPWGYALVVVTLVTVIDIEQSYYDIFDQLAKLWMLVGAMWLVHQIVKEVLQRRQTLGASLASLRADK